MTDVHLTSDVNPVILFDGLCGICNSWVDFVLKHDHRAVYRFAALQSDAGRDLLERFNLPTDFAQSLVLVEDEQIYLRSSGALRILRGLGMPFSLAYVSVLVPRVLRDHVYDMVAERRRRWFGERTVCRIPTASERDRFLV